MTEKFGLGSGQLLPSGFRPTADDSNLRISPVSGADNSDFQGSRRPWLPQFEGGQAKPATVLIANNGRRTSDRETGGQEAD
jgi:hypothetical protein